MNERLKSPFTIAALATGGFVLLSVFVNHRFIIGAGVATAAMVLINLAESKEPTVADAAFTPSAERWQAVIVTAADKRGRPTERRTVMARSAEDLRFEVDQHHGAIECAGLYAFRPVTIGGIRISTRTELLEPLMVDPSAIYLPQAERWRQRQERAR